MQALQRVWRYAQFSDRGHERYGDTFTVRIGSSPTAVLTRDREVIRRLYTGDPLGKRHGNDLLSTFLGAQSLLMLEPPEHLTRRKMLLPPFHGERVQAYARLMERLTTAELDRLRPGEVVKVQPIAQALTLDVILQAVFGVSDAAMRRRLRRDLRRAEHAAEQLRAVRAAAHAPRALEPAVAALVATERRTRRAAVRAHRGDPRRPAAGRA